MPHYKIRLINPFKEFLTILALTVIIPYGQGQGNNKVSEEITLGNNFVKSNKIENQQSHSFDTTFVINEQTINLEIRDVSEDKVTLTFIRNSKHLKTDTLQSAGLEPVEFTDFNKDGNSDILFTYMGNNPTYEIYLFDKTTNDFKYLKGFDRFPEAVQIETNPKYYFSYQRAGCADMNWISDLFYIDNFKTIHIGHIYGQGCDFELKENPQIIEIYMVFEDNEENKKEIEKLPYLKNIPDFGDKWDFIERYWNKNYGKFN